MAFFNTATPSQECATLGRIDEANLDLFHLTEPYHWPEISTGPVHVVSHLVIKDESVSPDMFVRKSSNPDRSNRRNLQLEFKIIIIN